MVLINQFRISDDGKILFLDAGVSSSDYFKDMYIKSLTLCTEEDVSETSTDVSNFIYRKLFGTITPHPIGEEHTIPGIVYDGQGNPDEEAESLYNLQNPYRGWILTIPSVKDSLGTKLSFEFVIPLSDYYVEEANSNTFIMVLDSNTHDISEGFSENAIIIEGTLVDNSNMVFNTEDGPIDVSALSNNIGVYVYEVKNGENKLIPFEYDETTQVDGYSDEYGDSITFKYLAYSSAYEYTLKDLNVVLDKGDFDEAYNNYNPLTGKPIDSDKPFANKAYNSNDLSNHLFFAYIETAGIPASGTPCKLDETTTLGVTFDYGVLFNKAMNYTRELANSCTIPSNFIDFILNFEALKLSIETEHWIPAIGYWKNLSRNFGFSQSSNSIIKPCRCNG